VISIELHELRTSYSLIRQLQVIRILGELHLSSDFDSVFINRLILKCLVQGLAPIRNKNGDSPSHQLGVSMSTSLPLKMDSERDLQNFNNANNIHSPGGKAPVSKQMLNELLKGEEGNSKGDAGSKGNNANSAKDTGKKSKEAPASSKEASAASPPASNKKMTKAEKKKAAAEAKKKAAADSKKSKGNNSSSSDKPVIDEIISPAANQNQLTPAQQRIARGLGGGRLKIRMFILSEIMMMMMMIRNLEQ
jgi:hypothetical protein